MQYQTTYSQGERYKKYSLMTVLANFQPAQKYSIKASPFTTYGCRLIIFDEKKNEMFNGDYSYISCDPGFHTKMASEIAENINLLLELENTHERIQPIQLEQTMLEVLNHCKLMNQKELEKYGYAVEIIFQ